MEISLLILIAVELAYIAWRVTPAERKPEREPEPETQYVPVAGPIMVDGSAVTQPISAASLPLPSGAATSANQSTANTSLSSLDTKLPSKGQTTKSGSTPVTMASDQAQIGAFAMPVYDYISLAVASTTDTWTYKSGGSGGTTVATITVTFTDSTKATISTVVKT